MYNLTESEHLQLTLVLIGLGFRGRWFQAKALEREEGKRCAVPKPTSISRAAQRRWLCQRLS